MASSSVFNVRAFGARGNGHTVETRQLQAAIDTAHASGGGTVRVQPGRYVTGTLHLQSGVFLYLEKDATLVGSTDMADYPADVASFTDAVGQKRGRCLLLAYRQHDVGLGGTGLIDGSGAAFREPPNYAERPFLVRFVECTNVDVRDVTLRNAAAWVSHYLCCDGVRIKGVKIDSNVNHNNDGMDIDSCRDVEISECDIITGDDAICLKTTAGKACEDIRVSRCRLQSRCGAIKIGTESYGDFRRINIDECRIQDTGLCGIKVISMDGAIIEDVTISNITMERTTGPIFIRLGERGRVYGDGSAPRRPAGQIRRITLENITAHVSIPPEPVTNPYTGEQEPPRAFSGMTIAGISQRKIESLTLRNLNVQFVGGGVEVDRELQPAQPVDHYPEHFYFGVLPAWAMYLQHVRHATLENVRFTTAQPDARPAVVCDDVDEVQGDNFGESRVAGSAGRRAFELR